MVDKSSKRLKNEIDSWNKDKERMCSMLFRYLLILMGIFGLSGSLMFSIKGNDHYYFCTTGKTNFLESMLFFFAALTSLVLDRYESAIDKDEEYKRYMRVYRIPAALAVFYFIYELYNLIICMFYSY